MEIGRNCFSARVVKPQNSLPEYVVALSTNVETFESRLDEVRSNQPVRACYKKSSDYSHNHLDIEEFGIHRS